MKSQYSPNMARVLSWIKSNAGSTKTELMAALNMTVNQVTHIFTKIRPHLITVAAARTQAGSQHGWAINTNSHDDITDFNDDENICIKPTVIGARIVRVSKIMWEAGFRSHPLKKHESRGVCSCMGANYD